MSEQDWATEQSALGWWIIFQSCCVSLIQMAAGLFIGRKSEPAETIHRSVDYSAVESFASICKGHKTQTWGHSNPNCIPDLLTLSPFADPDDTQTGRAGSSKAANQLYLNVISVTDACSFYAGLTLLFYWISTYSHKRAKSCQKQIYCISRPGPLVLTE